MEITKVAEQNFVRKQEYDVKKSSTETKDTENISGTVGTEAQDKEEIFKAVEKLFESDTNKMKFDETELRYSIHDEMNTVMIKLVDSKNDEIIKEFPSEKILNMVAAMCREAGLFVDKTV